MSAVQIAMIAGLPYTALRDAILTHPTLMEGLIVLFSSSPESIRCNPDSILIQDILQVSRNRRSEDRSLSHET